MEAASSYTVAVDPEPSMKNNLSVSTEFAFIDGLAIDTEYTIRVSAMVNGVQSPYGNEMTKIFVQVTEEEGESRELEFPVCFIQFIL